MATITPTLSVSYAGPGPGSRRTVVTWTGFATGDTVVAYEPQGMEGAVASVQVTGTFGSGTAVLAGSNDGTNFVTEKDATGTAISLTSAGKAEFSSAARYLRPSTSGGTSDSLTATLILRG